VAGGAADCAGTSIVTQYPTRIGAERFNHSAPVGCKVIH
jgi:hypothetical protein